jgi:hypothetical protein
MTSQALQDTLLACEGLLTDELVSDTTPRLNGQSWGVVGGGAGVRVGVEWVLGWEKTRHSLRQSSWLLTHTRQHLELSRRSRR